MQVSYKHSLLTEDNPKDIEPLEDKAVIELKKMIDGKSDLPIAEYYVPMSEFNK